MGITVVQYYWIKIRIYSFPTTEQDANFASNFLAESLEELVQILLRIFAAICLTAILRSHILSIIMSSIFLSLLEQLLAQLQTKVRRIFIAVMHILKLQSYVKSSMLSIKDYGTSALPSFSFLLISYISYDLTFIKDCLPSNQLLIEYSVAIVRFNSVSYFPQTFLIIA